MDLLTGAEAVRRRIIRCLIPPDAVACRRRHSSWHPAAEAEVGDDPVIVRSTPAPVLDGRPLPAATLSIPTRLAHHGQWDGLIATVVMKPGNALFRADRGSLRGGRTTQSYRWRRQDPLMPRSTREVQEPALKERLWGA
jgi:hypothetical protein